MEIYDHKEFLNFDDVARYLTDKGVSKFYPPVGQSEKALKDLLIEWIRNKKVEPVFYYDGVLSKSFELQDGCFSFKGWIYTNE